MNQNVIFVVEDEAKTQQLISETLKTEGFEVKCANSLFRARCEIDRIIPSLIILDRRLPDGDGADFCQQIRMAERTKDIPVLFLSAKGGLADRVTGLKMGGDDYLSKPFQLEELTARIEALLRRTKRDTEQASKVLQTKGIVLDLDKHECRVDGKVVRLWPKEFELLQTLMETPGRLLSRNFLSEKVWGFGYVDSSHTLDTTIQRLRKKLGKRKDQIETVKGYGYRLRNKYE